MCVCVCARARVWHDIMCVCIYIYTKDFMVKDTSCMLDYCSGCDD